MTHSDDLFQLIKNLSKGERAYFKKFGYKQNQADGQNRFYLKLFDYIDNQPEYNPEKIIRKFSTKTKGFHLPTSKKYLSKLLMKSLREYYALNDPQAQLNNFLCDVRILIDKGLKKQAEKVAKKARKIAEKNENYYALLQIQDMSDRLIAVDKHEYKNKEEAYRFKEHILKVLENINEFAWLRKKTHLSIYARSGGDIRTKKAEEELLAIIENDLLNHESKAFSHEAKYYFNSLFGYYYRAIGNNEKSLEFRIETVELFNRKPNLKVIFSHLYIGSMFNLLLMLNILNRHEEFDEYIEQFEEFTKEKHAQTSQYIQSYLFTFYAVRIEKNNLCADFDKNLPLIELVNSKLDFYAQQINERKLNDFYLEISITYFSLSRFADALDWLNKTINEERNRYTNENKYLVVKIMRIILHYELGNFDILDSLLQSTWRELSNVKKPMGFEKMLLKHLKKIAAYADSEESKPLFAAMLVEINKFVEKPNSNTEALSYFDFRSWVGAKVEGRGFGEVRRMKKF